MAKNLQPSKEEARKLGPVVLYGETQKLLEELGSKRLSAVPSTPLPSLVSVSVHLHAFAMQHRFNLKPVFSARRRTFKCTRFRSRSVKLDEPACEVFFEVIEAQGGWTVGEKMLEHTHRLNKHAKSHIRTRWSNLELGGTNPEDASYGNRASRTRKSTSISSLSNSGEDDSDSSSDSESEYDTAEEAEPAPGISGGFMHRSLAPQSASSQKVSAVTTVDGETAAWKLLQTEESEMRSAALYSETTHLLKSIGSIRLQASPASPSLSLKALSIHLHAFAFQRGFPLIPQFQVQKGRIFRCRRYRDHFSNGANGMSIACKAFFRVIENAGVWTVQEFHDRHTHELLEEDSRRIEVRSTRVSLGKRRLSSNSRRDSDSDSEEEITTITSRSQQKRFSERSDGRNTSIKSNASSFTPFPLSPKARHWDFPTTQEDLVEKANAIIEKTRSPPPFPSVDNGVCFPTAREFRIRSYAAARSQGFSLATYDADSKRAMERNEFRLRCSVQDRSAAIKSCGALMTVGCRKGYGGSDEWYVVEEDSHLYHVVDTKWKGKGKMQESEGVKALSIVPLKRHPSFSTFTPPPNSGSPSGIPPTKIFRPSPASTSQPRHTNSTKPLSSSSTPKPQARSDAPSKPAALPTPPPPVSSKSLTEFLYFLSPNLATFAALLHHRGVNNIDSLLLLFEQDKTTLSTFYNSLGSLTDLEKSTGSNLKVMPLFSASLLSSKLKSLKNGD